MAFNDKNMEVEFTEECVEEMLEIYEYISYNLKENAAAKRFISNVMDKIIYSWLWQKQNIYFEADIWKKKLFKLVITCLKK